MRAIRNDPAMMNRNTTFVEITLKASFDDIEGRRQQGSCNPSDTTISRSSQYTHTLPRQSEHTQAIHS